MTFVRVSQGIGEIGVEGGGWGGVAVIHIIQNEISNLSSQAYHDNVRSGRFPGVW